MKVFVISLKRSPERRRYIEKQLDDLNIQFEFFDAVDGRAEPPHPLFDNYDYTKRLWLTSGRMPSKGELGCYASHYLLWKECVELGTPILVLEDDTEIQEHIKSVLHIIEEKVMHYEFLRLEPPTQKCRLYTKEKSDSFSIDFMSNNFGGTRAYAISPKAALKLLKGSERWCMPVDNYIGSLYLHDMPSYLFSPCIIGSAEEFGTTIQLNEESKAKWFRKPSREIYSLYRKKAMKESNDKYK